MAFWGVEVKPGTPFTHAASPGNRRLHISQATLGTGSGAAKCVVQCNVGNSSPVFLCSLFPEKSESCQLNLEYDELNDVMLSVLGPRSVHLAGYFLPRSHQPCLNDESESYGEDIQNSDSDRSIHTDDDEYEDSFIDDEDSEDGPEEIEQEVPPKKHQHKRLRKLRELVDENEVSANEVEDFLLHSTSDGSKDASIETQSRVEQQTENKTGKEGDLERNMESVVNCEDGVKLNKKHNKPSKKEKESEADKLNSKTNETSPDKSSQLKLPNEEDTRNGEPNQEPTKVGHVKRKKIKGPGVKEETNGNGQDVEGIVDDKGTKRKRKRKEKACETDITFNTLEEIKDEQTHSGANQAEQVGGKNCSDQKKRKKKRNKPHESGVELIN